jgi:hypothetical protein
MKMIYRITAVLKVETDTITNISASLIGRAEFPNMMNLDHELQKEQIFLYYF